MGRLSLGAFHIVLILTFLHRAITIMVHSLNPLYAREVLDASLIEVGLTSTILSVTTLVTLYTFSASAPKNLIPYAITIGFGIGFVSTIGFYFAPNLQVFLIFIALMGLSNGLLHPLIMTLVALISTPKDLQRNLMLYTVSLSLSLVLGPLVESVLLVFVNLRSVFIFWSACASGGLVLSLFLPSRLGFLSSEQGHHGRVAFASTSLEFIRRLRNVLSIQIVVVMLTVNFGTTIFHSVLLTFGGVYARETFSVSYTTVMAVFAGMFFVVFLVRATLAGKPPLRRKMLALEAIVLEGIFAALLIFLSPLFEIFTIGFFLMGVFHGATFPIIITVIALNVDSDDLAFANSLVSSVPIITGILVPPVVGSLAQGFGIQEAALITLVPTALVAILVMEIKRRSYDLKANY